MSGCWPGGQGASEGEAFQAEGTVIQRHKGMREQEKLGAWHTQSEDGLPGPESLRSPGPELILKMMAREYRVRTGKKQKGSSVRNTKVQRADSGRRS